MPSSSRYQSRLFNFVRQQSRRLTEQCDRAFRHLQVSASWGMQLILYPVYVLFKSKRTSDKLEQMPQSWSQLPDTNIAAEEFSRQLPPDDANSQPQLPPTSDTPIQRVLLLVNVPLEEVVSTPSPASFSPNRNRSLVRGIATQISSRTLVLVTAKNEILDILTAQQQQELHEQIIGEVANYWHHQRLAHSVEIEAYPTITFSEREPLRGISSPLDHDLSNYQALTFLDRSIAALESNYLATVSKAAIIAQRSWELVLRVQTQLISSFGGTQPANSKSPTNVTDTHTFRIQALIWAAIDYFFGRRSGKQLGQTTLINNLELQAGSTRRRLLPRKIISSKVSSAQLPTQSVSFNVDPWLTLSDLFGEPSTKHISGLSNQTRFNQPCTQLEPAPDWIETNATMMGYVKHPLEQLLDWLDRVMLYLEDFLIVVWRWIQQLLRAVSQF